MKTLLLACLLSLSLRAVDVSGTYQSLGTVVTSSSMASRSDVSLRGLLGLEFDQPLACALYAGTARIVLTQTDSTFKISARDEDNNEIWNVRWQRDLGYDFDQKQVKLLFSSKTRKDDGYLFLLSLAGDERLLLAEVIDVHAGTFGPTGKPIGVFAFERTPRKDRKVSMK